MTSCFSQDVSSSYWIIIACTWDVRILHSYEVHCLWSCFNTKLNRCPSLNLNCILYELKGWICFFSLSLFNNLKTTLCMMVMLDNVGTSAWESQNKFLLIKLLLFGKCCCCFLTPSISNMWVTRQSVLRVNIEIKEEVTLTRDSYVSKATGKRIFQIKISESGLRTLLCFCIRADRAYFKNSLK